MCGRCDWRSLLLAVLFVEYIDLIELHGPEGQRYWLNPAKITTVREPLPVIKREHFAHQTRCVVAMSSGKFIAVADTCDHVIELVERHR